MPMSKPFDSTMKVLLELAPLDWLRLLGHNVTHARIVDADISTVSGAVDKAIRVGGKKKWIQHLEFQAGPDASKPAMLNVYNGIFRCRHKLPVLSTIILLSKKANLSTFTGTLTETLPDETEPYLIFHYKVVRVWELSPDELLKSIATMPLAPISDVPVADIPEVIAQIEQKMSSIQEPSLREDLWVTTSILMGLKYEDAFTAQMLKGVQGMEESTVYQAIIKKGEKRGAEKNAREIILQIGRDRFGTEPTDAIIEALSKITTIKRLNELVRRSIVVSSWGELLAPAPKKPTRTRKK